jgi:7-carboxy-7-deazaguanine synthase
MTSGEILVRVDELSGGKPLLVSLSGGNPALQPFDELIALGKRAGHEFALETQGSVARPWFRELDWLILSPKPPSSGMATDWTAFSQCLAAAGEGPRIALKIVVFDDADYAFARAASSRFPALPVYLQTGNPTPELGRGPLLKPEPESDEAMADFAGLRRSYAWLAAKAAGDGWFEARVLPQLHVLIWGNKRGV